MLIVQFLNLIYSGQILRLKKGNNFFFISGVMEYRPENHKIIFAGYKFHYTRYQTGTRYSSKFEYDFDKLVFVGPDDILYESLYKFIIARHNLARAIDPGA